MSRDANTKYIVANFRKIFDASHSIYVTYDDDLETINVRVVRDSTPHCNATFQFDVSSDDDEYYFVDLDKNFPPVVFDIENN